MKLHALIKVSLAAGALLFSTVALAADLTGKWAMTVETSMGSGTPTFDLVQEGNKLTGTYNGQLGQTDVAGTVDGDKFTISYTISAQGQSLPVTYSGTVQEDGTVKGEADMGEMLGKATFTGKKQ